VRPIGPAGRWTGVGLLGAHLLAVILVDAPAVLAVAVGHFGRFSRGGHRG